MMKFSFWFLQFPRKCRFIIPYGNAVRPKLQKDAVDRGHRLDTKVTDWTRVRYVYGQASRPSKHEMTLTAKYIIINAAAPQMYKRRRIPTKIRNICDGAFICFISSSLQIAHFQETFSISAFFNATLCGTYLASFCFPTLLKKDREI
jgi:hypothetical protein